MGVPSVIMSYNAKPVLIRRTGSVFRGVGSSRYLEIDIHVHKFANLAKKSIHALSSRCGLMYMQIGFVIEGRTDEELPETLFACVGVNRPEEDKVRPSLSSRLLSPDPTCPFLSLPLSLPLSLCLRLAVSLCLSPCSRPSSCLILKTTKHRRQI
jgi:hypothetical protein